MPLTKGADFEGADAFAASLDEGAHAVNANVNARTNTKTKYFNVFFIYLRPQYFHFYMK